ncbi:hypothetical protein [Micromonospora halophytica]|uniref:Uncharacterized protein n=1 Tax=Micromonospora halophytica TaxID=47864 RepID=A0A1C5J7V8_9ACTN|nr:hypothetical protein [Micromonospora halophytica]SCG66603.1 hypothetical protein GA0070560_12378 [Micromonospora halophytica]
MLDVSARQFVEDGRGLSPESLAAAFDRAVALRRAGGREASRATKPSAAENSELERAVRSALLPRAEELNAFRDGLHADAKSALMIAGRAILKVEQLSAEQYHVLVEPFVEVGVDVPAHPG